MIRILIVSIILALTACGGGADSDTAGTGIDGSGRTHASAGTVNSFGSVVVNGIRYDTSEADIFIRGELAQESDLSVGDHVDLIGTLNESGNTGTASIVHYRPSVSGQISSIESSDDRFVVLNQIIQVSAETVYSSNILRRNIHGLSVGDRVTVSGSRQKSGVIQASRIDRLEVVTPELIGIVTDLNKSMMTLTLGGQQIDFTDAIISQQDFNALSNDSLISVYGDRLMNEILFASEVAIINNITDDLITGDSVNLEGLATAPIVDNQFNVQQESVIVTQETVIQGGSIGNIEQGVKVNISGTLTEDNQIQADQVVLIPSADTILSGQLTGLLVSGDGFNSGVIEINGQEFVTDSRTLFVDSSSSQLRTIGIDNLVVGESLSLSAVRQGDESRALLIEREPSDGPIFVELRGFPDSLTETSVEILGRTALFDENTVFIVGDSEVNASDFAVSEQNSLLEISAQLIDSAVIAETVTAVVSFPNP